MAPNGALGGNIGANLDSVPNVKRDIKTLSDDEVAIDGVVYTMKEFVHPGGDVIRSFGGNDVSVQYRMIHPFHAPGVIKKMKAIGITTSQTEYKFGTDFEKDLKAAVAEIVKPNERFATFGFWFRCVSYIALYSASMFYYVNYGSGWAICFVLGVSQAFIGLNVQHDANHGAVSSNPLVNDILGYGADLIGGSKNLWLQQHWTHHTYTNDVTKDPDASSCDPFFLFHNYPQGSSARKAIHAVQHFYMLPVLSFYWLSSIISPAWFTLSHTAVKSAGLRFENEYFKSKRPIAIAVRVFYVFCTAISPFFHHNWPTALFHVWVLSTVESLTLAIPFALSHNFEGAERDPVSSKEPVDWYKSQVETSCTYGDYVAGWLTGGLNFQIEHHLFPRMSSAWYPYIRRAVMEVCKRHGVRYTYYPSFFSNWGSTLSYIAAVGRGQPSLPRPKAD